eukprot:scaffold81556_cov13-Prasinocladus_malaysianus.AAC.1
MPLMFKIELIASRRHLETRRQRKAGLNKAADNAESKSFNNGSKFARRRANCATICDWAKA